MSRGYFRSGRKGPGPSGSIPEWDRDRDEAVRPRGSLTRSKVAAMDPPPVRPRPTASLKEPRRSDWRLSRHPSLGEILQFREYVPAAEFPDPWRGPFDERVGLYWGTCPRGNCGTINGCGACHPDHPADPSVNEPWWWSIYLESMQADPIDNVREICPSDLHWWLASAERTFPSDD